MSNRLPMIKHLRALLIDLKSQVDDDYLDVTIGWSPDTGYWGFQTGDNSFTGGAYLHPHWAVVSLERRSNCTKLAREIRDQLSELVG
jgi:hypothetical protein